jgi:hypothetical protein
MSARPDDDPVDGIPRELGRACPMCSGRGQVLLAIGLNGERWATYECGLCLGAAEITVARENELRRLTEDLKP